VHSRMLLPLCLRVLKEAEMELKELSAIAVSEGPGSFTGLRIGCATAQGLAYALGKPVVMVPTFQVLTYQVKDLDCVAVVQGKARGQTVGALYLKSEKFEPHGAGPHSGSEHQGLSEVISPRPWSFAGLYGEIIRKLAGKGISEVWVTGDAARIFCGSVAEETMPSTPPAPCFLPVEDDRSLPLPGNVGLIGVRLFIEGRTVEPQAAVPRYYRKAQAEAKAEGECIEGDVICP